MYSFHVAMKFMDDDLQASRATTIVFSIIISIVFGEHEMSSGVFLIYIMYRYIYIYIYIPYYYSTE